VVSLRFWLNVFNNGHRLWCYHLKLNYASELNLCVFIHKCLFLSLFIGEVDPELLLDHKRIVLLVKEGVLKTKAFIYDSS
jgi:hypothetical protein